MSALFYTNTGSLEVLFTESTVCSTWITTMSINSIRIDTNVAISTLSTIKRILHKHVLQHFVFLSENFRKLCRCMMIMSALFYTNTGSLEVLFTESTVCSTGTHYPEFDLTNLSSSSLKTACLVEILAASNIVCIWLDTHSYNQ
jgi:hypothetical protein